MRKLEIGPYGSTVEEGRRLLQDLTPINEKIHLHLEFRDHDFYMDDDPDGGGEEYVFNSVELLELEDLLRQKKSCIQRFEVDTCCDHLEPFRIFKLFVRAIQENNGEIKEFSYEDDLEEELSVEHAIQLGDALRLNNNYNNGVTIEYFHFGHIFQKFEGLQHVWNALIDTGVESLDLNTVVSVNDLSNDTIDFSHLINNRTLKELDLTIHQNKPNTTLTGTNIFESIKFNKTLEKLHINYDDLVLENRELSTLQEMLHTNSTLIDVRFNFKEIPVDFKKESNNHTEINRKWKRYKSIKCEEERATIAAAAAAAAATIDIVDADIVVDGITEREKKIQEETKMMKTKEELWICLNEFDGKPVICNDVIFSYLRNYSNSYMQDQLSIKKVEGIFEQTLCLFDGTELARDEKLRVLKKLHTAITLSDHDRSKKHPKLK